MLTNEIEIMEAFDPTSGPPPSETRTYLAIWDTGATSTVISKRIADDLGLPPSGMATVRGVGSGDTPHEYQTNTYLVNLVLPNGVSMVGVRVVEGSVSGGEILIGMDVIGQGDFAITHHEGKTTWSFRSPSCDEIDFVPSADRHNTRLQRQSPESKKRQRQTRNKTKADKRKPRKK